MAEINPTTLANRFADRETYNDFAFNVRSETRLPGTERIGLSGSVVTAETTEKAKRHHDIDIVVWRDLGSKALQAEKDSKLRIVTGQSIDK